MSGGSRMSGVMTHEGSLIDMLGREENKPPYLARGCRIWSTSVGSMDDGGMDGSWMDRG